MRKPLIFLLLFCFGFSLAGNAIVISPAISRITSMKVKDIERITGRKMSLKEKIAFTIVKHRWKKKQGSSNTARTASVFGIIAIVTACIPYVFVIALPCAILALVFGYKARRKNPDDKKARNAIVLGWISIG